MDDKTLFLSTDQVLVGEQEGRGIGLAEGPPGPS